MIELAVIILAILYLCGYNVGKALAICSIIEVFCVIFAQYLKIKKFKKTIDK